jgi:hypothetical protein
MIPVAYDDLKEFDGRTYSGVSIGGEHVWRYPDGLWQERKVAPDRWIFTFSSLKRRTRSAPEGSGSAVGTGYHWFILAHQKVLKRDKDTYETRMEGVKYKVAHRRPHWRHWSTAYPDHEPERDILIRILEEQLEELKSGSGSGNMEDRGLYQKVPRGEVYRNLHSGREASCFRTPPDPEGKRSG